MWRCVGFLAGLLLLSSLSPALAGDGKAAGIPHKSCLPKSQGSGGVEAPRWVTITLFRDTRYEGRSCTFDGDIADLNTYAFAGIASSVRIQGGIWQLCEKPNYRGFCIELDRSQTDFNLFGFNDRARSLRRIR
jgi:hypothetical protein